MTGGTGLRFFVDETSLGLGKALAIARHDVVHPGHPDLPSVPRGTLDPDWMPIVSAMGLVVISRDKRIRTKPAELAAPVMVTPSSPVVGLDQTLQVVQTVQTVSKPSTPSMYGFLVRTDAPTCPECGSIMVPNGSCHKCTNCGTTSGCS